LPADARRWAKPITVIDIETSASDTITFPDGRTYRDVDVTAIPDDIERMRLGRMCIVCFEPLEEAFPENCEVCGFDIRARQLEVYEVRYAGERRIGPSIDYEAEAERLGELDAYESRTGIILPDHIKFPQGPLK
jgi:hypothetical protein